MTLNLPNVVEEFLKENNDNYYTARDIAEWICKNKEAECKAKIERTRLNNKQDLIKQIVAEIGRHNSSWGKRNIHMTSDRPHKYYYDNHLNEILNENNSKLIKHNEQKEHELYPKLAQFCKSIGIKTLRIDEKKSIKDKGKNYNKWLHADVVGFKDLTENYDESTKECMIEHSTARSLLYGFEVKDGSIKCYNLRENFFSDSFKFILGELYISCS